MRRALVALAAIPALLATLALPSDARTLRWGNQGDVMSMDPYAYYTTINASFLQNIYEPLIRFDRNLKLEPSLATEWRMTDATTWRFTLRPGVKFHDGSPFTADDVVASLKRASHPDSPYRPATHAIKDVRKVEELVVDVEMQTPYPILINDLSGVYIMSRDWLAKHGALEPFNPAKGGESYAHMNANGTGPFILKSRRPDSETVLTVNPNWWDKTGHNLTEVVFKPVNNDATRVAGLLSGELDLIVPAPLQDIERIQKSPDLQALLGDDLRVMYFGLNLGVAELNAGNVKGKNPLADVRVRQALYQAVDVEAISKRLMRGYAKPIATMVAPQIQGYDPALAERAAPFDPEAAKKLLAEAGYPNGFQLGLDCPSDRFVNAERMCQSIVPMWERIGVKVVYSPQPDSIYFKKMMSGGSDVFLIGWANTPQIDAYSILNNCIHTPSPRHGRWNPGKYSNPEVDRLIESASVELDLAKRTKLMSDAFRIFRAEYGAIPLYQEPLAWAARKNVKVAIAPDNKMRLFFARMD
ncbi:MAG: ABC transporter substrate-binding protein [Alphaproteobacteria bacterium]|nr:ABC transporter substrate-binding protein [Alphaproteobacteria bacterium]